MTCKAAMAVLRTALPSSASSQAAAGKTLQCKCRGFVQAWQEACIYVSRALPNSSNRQIQTFMPEIEVCIGVVSTRKSC